MELEPAAAVLDHARAHEVELIAMAIPSSPDDDRALDGHASLTVLHHADVPVLLIPNAAGCAVEELPTCAVRRDALATRYGVYDE